jgi:hypothetical protein
MVNCLHMHMIPSHGGHLAQSCMFFCGMILCQGLYVIGKKPMAEVYTIA